MEKNSNLGKWAKDKVTGFEGTVTGYAQYLYEDDLYCIESKEGEKKAHWFIEKRIEFTE
jgi:hypothetical protein